MKRSRDGGFTNSIHKQQTVPSPIGPSRRAQVNGGSGKVTPNDALSYLTEVKNRFQDQKGKYDDFLKVMKDFKAQSIDTATVVARVKKLFSEDRDLILGFNAFLPGEYVITLENEDEPAITMKKPAEFGDAVTFVNKIKTRFRDDDHVYKSFLGILDTYRRNVKTVEDVKKEIIDLFGDNIDLIEEFGHFLPCPTGKASNNYHHPGSKYGIHSNYRNYRSSTTSPIRIRHADTAGALYAKRDFSFDRSDVDHDKFGMGIDKELQRNGDRGKERRDNREWRVRKLDNRDYDHDSAQHISPSRNLALKVEDSDQFSKGALWSNSRKPLSMKVDLNGDQNRKKHYKDRDHDNRERERLDRTALGGKDGSESKLPLFSCKEEFLVKPIQELDLSDCERCTPSYRLLPKNYPIPSASRRTDTDAKVLNDQWVSVTSGSEDYSFKHMRKNRYEESLFRCEDDRYELEMLLESVKATRKSVEELLVKINDNTIETRSVHIEDHFTVLHLRCIERVYGDHGLDVMDLLIKNPPLSLEIILNRLKQKEEEWTRCLSEYSKVWAEIYAKNYHKSLDHRSFYFKQQDSKNLSTEALLAEIEELSENQCGQDDVLITIAAGNRRPILPNLEFQLSDSDIHGYLYQLIRTSCQYMCTPEQFGKVVKVYSTLLKSMFGIPSHLQHAEDTKNFVKDDLANSADPCMEENQGSLVGVASINDSRQSNPYRNGRQHILVERSSSSAWLGSNNRGVIKDDEHDSYHISPKSGTAFKNSHREKEQINVTLMDEASRIRKVEQPQYSSIAAAAGAEDSYERVKNEDTSGLFAALESGEDVASEQPFEYSPLSAEGADCTKEASALNGAMTESIEGQKCNEESVEQFTIEREEGELSPNGDYVEQNFQAYEEDNHKPKNGAAYQTRHGEEICYQEEGVETDDNGKSNVCKSSDDSVNTSENHDSSGSESADDCSPEEHEGGHEDRDTKAESEDDMKGKEVDAHDVEANGMMLPLPEHFVKSVRPLVMHVPFLLQDKEKKKSSHIFYGNDSFYVLFRLYQTLYDRIKSVKSSSEKKWMVSNDTTPAELCDRFMNAFYKLLDGSSENTEFEDHCRTLMGAESYILFTLDNLVRKFVNQLKTVATDGLDNKLLQLYEYEKSRTGRSFTDIVYHNNARALLHDDKIYRIESSSEPLHMSIQLMDYGYEKPERDAVSMDTDFVNYLNNGLLHVSEENQEPGVVLKSDELSDTYQAMEEFQYFNGLECKITSNPYKVGYVLGTEDFLSRKKRSLLHSASSQDQAYLSTARVQRFHRVLMC